ncbi:MAG: inorganic phosphate transporter [Alphaproteobacteria bacterium]|nr:inorganic phosphate transporter [Alphaproteobacteria bacterium]
MISAVILSTTTLALAWANGANDVSKGVAALTGSGVATPRAAWILGVLATLAGGLAAIMWGGALGTLFGGGFLKGASELPVGAALAALAGAAGFVLLATWQRWPVSTTHALIGGIIGAAIVQFGIGDVAYRTVAAKFLVPLLASPVLAIGLCWVLLLLNRALEARMPHWTPGCCDPADYKKDPFVCAPPAQRPSLLVRRFWLALHWLSGGAVSFARGLNDVPKMAALMIPAFIATPALISRSEGPALAIAITALAMTGGAVMAGRRLLPVLATEVSTMTPSTGLFANLGTALLVLGATPLGLPVSTTHVAAGSLIGVRVADHAPPRARDALRTILMAWLVTLPSAAIFSAVIASIVTR